MRVLAHFDKPEFTHIGQVTKVAVQLAALWTIRSAISDLDNQVHRCAAHTLTFVGLTASYDDQLIGDGLLKAGLTYGLFHYGQWARYAYHNLGQLTPVQKALTAALPVATGVAIRQWPDSDAYEIKQDNLQCLAKLVYQSVALWTLASAVSQIDRLPLQIAAHAAIVVGAMNSFELNPKDGFDYLKGAILYGLVMWGKWSLSTYRNWNQLSTLKRYLPATPLAGVATFFVWSSARRSR